MSHFLTLVIIPGNTPMNRVEHVVDDMLEPFSQHLEADGYEDECGCIGSLALREVQAEIAKEYNIETMRKEFHSLPKKKQTEKCWKQMTAPMEKKRRELLIAHPLVDKPNPECSNCGGTGKYICYCNPYTKWDWWVIGGRWDGWIFGPERQNAAQKKEGGTIFGADENTLKNNCRRVSEIPIAETHYVPFAIVTPDGEWVEQGEMCMWATVSNEKDFAKWHEIAKEVLAKYPEHLAVAVDCHI